MDAASVVMVFLIVLTAIAVAWRYTNRRRTLVLRTHYGSEYDRLVRTDGRRGVAAELEDRSRRVRRLAIRPLNFTERTRYAEKWRDCQAKFVDDPGAAVLVADGLVEDVMRLRGYPVGDFDRQAADISVDHPRLVEDYRAAHLVATSHRRTPASTEELREAMVHYHALFDDLLEMPENHEVRVQ